MNFRTTAFSGAFSSGVIGALGRAGGQEPAIRTASPAIGGSRLPLLSPARTYTCGITPYDVTHLGHAATFVWADAVTSIITMAGADVVACRNVTDVDDVLTRAASSRGRPYDEFALTQEYLFTRDMAALRVRTPAHEPRARHHVGDVVRLAAALLATGHAYEREGHVYFRGAGVPVRAGLDRERALALAAEYGDEPDDPRREDPFDVAVWLPSPEDYPGWPSPWGWGRPGWHAGCAAMAAYVHGASIDLLMGGADLAFPHHAYQAALVEAATGVTPFARATMHIGEVHRDGTKMAKSTGNLVLVGDLLRDHAPAAIRILLLDRRWDTAWEYDEAQLGRAAQRLDRLHAAAGRPASSAASSAAAKSAASTEAMAAALLAGFDVPAALDIAEEAGGETARALLGILALV